MVIDIHGHFLDLAFRAGARLHESLGAVTDVPTLRAGKVSAQLCATWTPDIALSGPHSHSVPIPLRSLLGLMDYLHGELGGPAGADVILARTSADLLAAEKKGAVAVIVGMEGTDALCGDPAVLRIFHRLGLRHVGLVHEHANEFGAASQVWEEGKMRRYDPARDPEGHLTPAGRALLAEMERLGLVVDVCHLVEPGFSEVLQAYRRPVIVGHGGARGVTDSVRYLTDDQVRAVARSGGVVGASPLPLGPSPEKPGLPLLLDTVDYLVRLVGPDHVAIGTDFKELPANYPPGFANSAETPALARALRARGHSESAVAKIMGDNFLRVFRAVAS